MTPPQQGQSFEQFRDPLSFVYNPVGHSVAFLQFLGTVLYNILRLACVPAEIIFRREFGERHFNLSLYIGGSIWLAIFATGWLNIPATMGFRNEGLVPNALIFTIIALIFYARMFWYLFLVKSKEINAKMYSYYEGTPHYFLSKLPFAKDKNGNVRDAALRQYIEPAFMLVSGIVFSVILNPQTGTWLILSSFCMAIKAYVQARHTRNLILDQIDSQIIGQNLAGALKGEPPSDTQGVFIAGVSGNGKDRDYLKSLGEENKDRFTNETVGNS